MIIYVFQINTDNVNEKNSDNETVKMSSADSELHVNIEDLYDLELENEKVNNT